MPGRGWSKVPQMTLEMINVNILHIAIMFWYQARWLIKAGKQNLRLWNKYWELTGLNEEIDELMNLHVLTLYQINSQTLSPTRSRVILINITSQHRNCNLGRNVCHHAVSNDIKCKQHLSAPRNIDPTPTKTNVQSYAIGQASTIKVLGHTRWAEKGDVGRWKLQRPNFMRE